MAEEWELEYLRAVVAETGESLSAIARKAGVSSTTLTRPMNDSGHSYTLKRATLDKVAAATGIGYLRFLAGNTTAEITNTLTATNSEPTLVPVYDVAAAAGAGMIVDEYEAIATNLAFPPDYLRQITRTPPDRLAIISVVGGSMAPTLSHDDIVMVDTTKTRWAFDGIYVVQVDGLLKVKRLRRSEREGWVALVSDNPSFPAEDLPGDEVTVIGRVVWSGRKET